MQMACACAQVHAHMRTRNWELTLSYHASCMLCGPQVSHGLAIRILLMRWFHWTVNQFMSVYNPPNSEVRVCLSWWKIPWSRLDIGLRIVLWTNARVTTPPPTRRCGCAFSHGSPFIQSK